MFLLTDSLDLLFLLYTVAVKHLRALITLGANPGDKDRHAQETLVESREW